MEQDGGTIQINGYTRNMTSNQYQASQNFCIPPQLPYQNCNHQYMAMNSASPIFSPETTHRNVNTQSYIMSIILQRHETKPFRKYSV